jgi:phosphoserine phosphatase
MRKPEKIVVVDLDKTLLIIDSFNLFLSVQLKKRPLKTALLRILRKLRLISLSKLKELSGKYIYDKLPEEEKKSFIKSLNNYINKKILNKINSEYGKSCRIIIISASPDEYVKVFAASIGWEGFGSYTDNSTSRFIHLHGKGKSDFLLKYFPADKYTYEYSISDSQSDLPLLKLFKKYDLFEAS